ncbi:DUF6491 family protein [Candidatus Foliamicus sp.]
MRARSALGPLLALLLFGCTAVDGDRSVATTRPQMARFPHSSANADCFYSQRVDNFEVLNDSNLLVFDGRRRVYHVEIAPPSLDLRYAYGIEFLSTSGRICGNAGERLVTRNGGASRFPQMIVGVYRLDETLQTTVRAHFGQTIPAPALPEDADAEAVEELVIDLEGEPEAVDEDSASLPGSSEQEN